MYSEDRHNNPRKTPPLLLKNKIRSTSLLPVIYHQSYFEFKLSLYQNKPFTRPNTDHVKFIRVSKWPAFELIRSIYKGFFERKKNPLFVQNAVPWSLSGLGLAGLYLDRILIGQLSRLWLVNIVRSFQLLLFSRAVLCCLT